MSVLNHIYDIPVQLQDVWNKSQETFYGIYELVSTKNEPLEMELEQPKVFQNKHNGIICQHSLWRNTIQNLYSYHSTTS